MMFWMGILVGGIFAWLAVKWGLYQTWAAVFNIIISIYLSLYLRPIIVNTPVVGNTPYSNILAVVAVALASFLILHGISYTFLIGQFSVTFPKSLDALGSSFLGFAAGFLIWSFLSLLVYVTPVSQNSLVKQIGFTDQFQQTSISYISRFCNYVNAVVSFKDNKYSAEQTIDKLLKDAKSKTQKKTSETFGTIEPAQKPGNAKTGVTDPNQLGPPPELSENQR
jgi:hypothetical protein